jgi:pilus assembly protein Flp/PilA
MLKHLVTLQLRMLGKKSVKGQSLAEYGLILALVAVFCIGALQLLGGNVSTMVNNLATTIAGVPTSPGG